MTVHCAVCKGFICRGGNRSAAPDDCPMRGEFPAFPELYPEGEIRDFLVKASRLEGAGYCKWTRLREVAEFARSMGYSRVGLAHDPDMAEEARLISGAFEGFGLTSLFPPLTSLFPPLKDPASPRFDPAHQADFFLAQGADLIVLAGMSVGHEAILVQSSQLPTVALVARDSRLGHNPVAALYTSRGYLKDELFGHWPPGDRPPFGGWDSEHLGRVADGTGGVAGGPMSRLAEAMELAHRLGVTHIGLSFCVGLREEAETLSGILESNGFRVSSACCKTGSVPKEEAGIRNDEKVRPGRAEMICNPAAQAELLNRECVEFTLVLGQCVGHDAATFRRLEAPAACLMAKDRVLAHNSVAALR